MTLNEVKANLKKDPASSFLLLIHRRLGVTLTWIIINMFPRITANSVTLSMIPFNLIASAFLFFAVSNRNYVLLFTSFLLWFFSTTLDCVDGNIARIKGEQSLLGVLYDRVVHNISHPIFFTVAGFACYMYSENIFYMIPLLLAAFVCEFPPVGIAMQDTEIFFLRQLAFGKTKNYDWSTHSSGSKEYATGANLVSRVGKQNILIKSLKSIFSISNLYVVLALDLYLFERQFYLTSLFSLAYSATKVIVHTDLEGWQQELVELLSRLDQVIEN